MFNRFLVKTGLDSKQIKSISAIAIGNISVRAFRFLFWLIVIWIVTPDEYGYVRYSLTIANFLSLPIVSGFAGAITKFISEHTGHNKKMEIYAFQTILLDSIIMILVVILVILLGLTSPEQIPILSAYIVITLGLYNIYSSYVRGLMDIKRIVAFGVSVNVSRVVFVLILYLLNLFGLLWVIVAYSFPLAIGLFVGRLFRDKTLNIKKYPLDFSIVKKISVFALPGILSAGMWMLVGQVDIIFVNAYLGFQEVAYYSLAKTLSSVIGFVAGAIIVLQMPKISSFRDNKKKIYTYTKKSLKLAFLATGFLALLLYISSKFILELFFPETYIASLPLIYILIPGSIFSSLFAILGATWTGYGKPIEEAKAVFFGAISILSLNFLLIPSYGALGSATAFTLSQTIIFLLLYYKTIRYFT